MASVGDEKGEGRKDEGERKVNGREGGSDGETQYRGRKGVKCKGRKGKVR